MSRERFTERESPVVGWLRLLALVAAAALVVTVIGRFWLHGVVAFGSGLVGLALCLAIVSQRGLGLDDAPFDAPATPVAWPHRWFGAVVALAGMALWGWGSYRLRYFDWAKNFDSAWIAWLGAAVIMHVGFDLMWGRKRPPGIGRARRWVLPCLVLLVAVTTLYRLGNVAEFPGEGSMTQVEDLQTGNWGLAFLRGGRIRWEYLSHAWVSALGIWLLGPTELAMRIPFGVISVLKVIPVFFWGLWTVGPVGAVVGAALFAYSGWDTMLSRTPNNHDALVVATVFALLAGPARRGRPSAYVWLGLLGGYVLYEYVGYRPLAAYAVLMGFVQSLRDRTSGWTVRLGRPLLTLAMILSMAAPLFLNRLPGRIWEEYFNGWNRARAIAPYYNPNDTWAAAAERRLERVQGTIGLFVFQGDPSPVHNTNGWALVDPFTATLLLCGLGFALGNTRRPVIGLTGWAFLITLAGALVLTGNFDVGRAGGTVVYVYTLAGFGAAAFVAAFGVVAGQAGRAVAMVVLAGGLVFAGVWNTKFLFEYWQSPVVRRAMRTNLGYLSGWLRRNARADEQVVGIGPGVVYVLSPNDSEWLRGREMKGVVTWDIEEALRYWAFNDRPTLFFVMNGATTQEIRAYLESLFPGLTLTYEPDPWDAGADIAFAHLSGKPPGLAPRLETLQCRGAEWTFEILDENEVVLQRVERTVPFVDSSTWPGKAREAIYRSEGRARQVRVRATATFTVEAEGRYEFWADTFVGRVTLTVDGAPYPLHRGLAIPLTAGAHTIEAAGAFEPLVNEPSMRISWLGPDTGGQVQLMPFYRLAAANPSCAVAEPE